MPVLIHEPANLLLLNDGLCKGAGNRSLLCILGGLMYLSDLGSDEIFDFISFDSAMCDYVVGMSLAVEVDLG